MSKLFLRHIFLGIFFLKLIVNGYAFSIDPQNSIPLIPRHVLFGNPEKGAVSISPNGTMLAYLAPCNGALNVWIKTVGQTDDHVVTHDRRGIKSFSWACNNQYILFIQDENGDENWHIFRTNIKTKETVDMTPYQGIRAHIHSIDKHFPNEILITMNKENPKLFDVYCLHIESGTLELISKNPGNVDYWLPDSTLCVRAEVVVNSDESTALLVRDNKESPWIRKVTWRFEDSLPGSVPARGSRPISFSSDGTSLYLIDSTNSNTQRLIKLNLLTCSKEVLAKDELYDIHSVVVNSDTYEPDLVSFQKDRTEWKAINPLFQKDLENIVKANKGDLQSIERSADMIKWVLRFVNDDMPNTYYLYDRQTENLNFFFMITQPS